jgi:hypothetical protein
MEHDLTINCTIALPTGAVLNPDCQTFVLNGKEFVLNTITFSSTDDGVAIEVIDLPITDVFSTIFSEVVE